MSTPEEQLAAEIQRLEAEMERQRLEKEIQQLQALQAAQQQPKKVVRKVVKKRIVKKNAQGQVIETTVVDGNGAPTVPVVQKAPQPPPTRPPPPPPPKLATATPSGRPVHPLAMAFNKGGGSAMAPKAAVVEATSTTASTASSSRCPPAVRATPAPPSNNSHRPVHPLAMAFNTGGGSSLAPKVSVVEATATGASVSSAPRPQVPPQAAAPSRPPVHPLAAAFAKAGGGEGSRPPVHPLAAAFAAGGGGGGLQPTSSATNSAPANKPPMGNPLLAAIQGGVKLKSTGNTASANNTPPNARSSGNPLLAAIQGGVKLKSTNGTSSASSNNNNNNNNNNNAAPKPMGNPLLTAIQGGVKLKPASARPESAPKPPPTGNSLAAAAMAGLANLKKTGSRRVAPTPGAPNATNNPLAGIRSTLKSRARETSPERPTTKFDPTAGVQLRSKEALSERPAPAKFDPTAGVQLRSREASPERSAPTKVNSYNPVAHVQLKSRPVVPRPETKPAWDPLANVQLKPRAPPPPTVAKHGQPPATPSQSVAPPAPPQAVKETTDEEKARQVQEGIAKVEAELQRRQQLEREIQEMEAMIAMAAAKDAMKEAPKPKRKVVKRRVIKSTASKPSQNAAPVLESVVTTTPNVVPSEPTQPAVPSESSEPMVPAPVVAPSVTTAEAVPVDTEPEHAQMSAPCNDVSVPIVTKPEEDPGPMPAWAAKRRGIRAPPPVKPSPPPVVSPPVESTLSTSAPPVMESQLPANPMPVYSSHSMVSTRSQNSNLSQVDPNEPMPAWAAKRRNLPPPPPVSMSLPASTQTQTPIPAPVPQSPIAPTTLSIPPPSPPPTGIVPEQPVEDDEPMPAWAAARRRANASAQPAAHHTVPTPTQATPTPVVSAPIQSTPTATAAASKNEKPVHPLAAAFALGGGKELAPKPIVVESGGTQTPILENDSVTTPLRPRNLLASIEQAALDREDRTQQKVEVVEQVSGTSNEQDIKAQEEINSDDYVGDENYGYYGDQGSWHWYHDEGYYDEEGNWVWYPYEEEYAQDTVQPTPSPEEPIKPPARGDLLSSIAFAAKSREKRLEETNGKLIMKEHEPEVAAKQSGPPQLSFNLTEMVTKKAKEREERLAAGGEKKMTKIKEKEEYKKDFVDIALEAAAMGRLTRLNEHSIEAVAQEKTPEEEWKSKGLLAIQWRSNHMAVIFEAARAGAAFKLPEKVVSNCPEWEEDPEYEEDGLTPRMQQLLDLTTEVGTGQHKVDKLVLGMKEENAGAESLAIKPMVYYQNIEDVKLPRPMPPKIDIEKHKKKLDEQVRKSKRPLSNISDLVAEKAWERRTRMDRPGALPRMKTFCACPYCINPTPYQTHAYKEKARHYKTDAQMREAAELERQKLREQRRKRRDAIMAQRRAEAEKELAERNKQKAYSSQTEEEKRRERPARARPPRVRPNKQIETTQPNVSTEEPLVSAESKEIPIVKPRVTADSRRAMRQARRAQGVTGAPERPVKKPIPSAQNGLVQQALGDPVPPLPPPRNRPRPISTNPTPDASIPPPPPPRNRPRPIATNPPPDKFAGPPATTGRPTRQAHPVNKPVQGAKKPVAGTSVTTTVIRKGRNGATTTTTTIRKGPAPKTIPVNMPNSAATDTAGPKKKGIMGGMMSGGNKTVKRRVVKK